jgi:REP element-mobilizing transposase RayT
METSTRRRIRLAEGDYNKDHTFYLTICTNGRRPCFGEHPRLANRCVTLLGQLAAERNSELFAYCVMPDHVHLLLRDLEPIGFVRLV